MHPQLFHRDIRWPNIMQNATNPDKWFLIDWDDTSFAPTQACSKIVLNPKSHASQVFQDGHSAEVDIWGVGYLLITAPIHSLPEYLLSFGQQMMNRSIKSAGEALERLL